MNGPTIVRYFVLETDQYDEPQHPNIFRISKAPDQIKLKDIKERFTDWKGGFRYYFKTTLDPSKVDDFVWEDIIDEEHTAPKFQGAIIVKAVRTGFKQFFEIKNRDKEVTAPALVKRDSKGSLSPTGATSPSSANLALGAKKKVSVPASPRDSNKVISASEDQMLEQLTKGTHFSIQELKAMFLKFRKETPNLEIDRSGFLKVTRGMGIEDEFLQDLIFNKFDTDKSGSIDFTEFVKGLSVITRGTAEEKLQSAFEMYDINGDGHISKEEFKKILSSFVKFKGGSITMSSGKTYQNIDEMCNDFFTVMDPNSDGEISFEEFKLAAMKNPDIMNRLNIL